MTRYLPLAVCAAIALLFVTDRATIAAEGPTDIELLFPYELKWAVGNQLFEEGDDIVIESIRGTAPEFEKGSTVFITGQYKLASHDTAQLALYLTQTAPPGTSDTEQTQWEEVPRGEHRFVLSKWIRHDGYLHLSYYDLEKGQAFGSKYFGSEEQMARIANWDLSSHHGG